MNPYDFDQREEPMVDELQAMGEELAALRKSQIPFHLMAALHRHRLAMRQVMRAKEFQRQVGARKDMGPGRLVCKGAVERAMDVLWFEDISVASQFDHFLGLETVETTDEVSI